MLLDKIYKVCDIPTLIEAKEFELVKQFMVDKSWESIYSIIKPYINEVHELYEMKDINSNTLLMHTIVSDPKTAEIIIANDKCDYNLQNSKGLTVLMLACKQNSEVLVSKLLETGKCDLGIRTKGHYTACTYAKRRGISAELVTKLTPPSLKRKK